MICAEAPIETFICSGLVVKILTFLSNCSSCTKAEFLRPLRRQAWFGRLSDETSRLHWYSNRQSVFTVASSKFCTCNTLYLWKLSSASVFSRPTSGSNCGSLNGHRAVLSLIQAAKGFLMLTQEFVSLALNSRNCPVWARPCWCHGRTWFWLRLPDFTNQSTVTSGKKTMAKKYAGHLMDGRVEASETGEGFHHQTTRTLSGPASSPSAFVPPNSLFTSRDSCLFFSFYLIWFESCAKDLRPG